MTQTELAMVKAGSDLVEAASKYTRLERCGHHLEGCCPFHADPDRSFRVSRERQLFKCFRCGEEGDIIRFTMRTENVTFQTAIRLLREKIKRG